MDTRFRNSLYSLIGSHPLKTERVDRGGGDTGIRGGRGTGVKGAGTGGEGTGVGNFWGRGLYQNLLYFTDFTLFLCTSMR